LTALIIGQLDHSKGNC